MILEVAKVMGGCVQLVKVTICGALRCVSYVAKVVHELLEGR